MLQTLSQAAALRSRPRSDALRGRTLVMFFEKTSTRTRLSFEIGMAQLGGHAVHLDRESSQLTRGESLRDTAQVVSRYADLLMARVHAHSTLTELSDYSTIPVINGLSDLEHPVQSMGDLLTIQDHLGKLGGQVLAYVGDGHNNVAHSLLLACSLVGVDIRIACPPDLRPNPDIVSAARRNAEATKSKVEIGADPRAAAAGANVLYTDVWVSMGQEASREPRLKILRDYQVNSELAGRADPSYIFMHCLPQHIGEEVSEEVAYGDQSVIFDQAESRLHIQKALMLFLLGQEGAAHG